MSTEPSAATLKKHIRKIVAAAKGEPVGLKTLLKTLEGELGLGKGALGARKNEVRDLLVAVMEEEDVEEDSSSDEEVVTQAAVRERAATRGAQSAAAPEAANPRESMMVSDEASDKTAGKSRAGQVPDFAGFLKKRGDQGRLKLWRKRHFRLYKKEGVIAYFASDKESDQLGEISVTGAFLIDKRDDLGKFAFAITMKTTARVWILQAPDEGTMKQWLDLCTPLMKEVAAVRAAGGKKPPKPANGLPLAFPPTYVQGFADREQCVSRIQEGELDWTKLSHAPVTPATLTPGTVALALHGGKLAVVEEVRQVSVDDKGETFLQDVPKQLKYSADSLVWSSAESTLMQHRVQVDEKTQRDLLKKLVGQKIACSVPGTGHGHGEDAGKRQETRLGSASGDAAHHHHHHGGSGGLAFPNDAKFTGKLYYDQQDERYALVEEGSNTVHFLNTRDARTITLAEANVTKLNTGTDATFIAPRVWARFQAKSPQSQGLLTYRLKEAFEFHTNYVFLLSADEKQADVEGVFSVWNKTSKTYNNAQLKVIPDPEEEAKKKEKKKDAVEEAAKDLAKEEATKKVGGGLMALAGAFLKKEETAAPPPPRIYEYPVAQRVTLPAYDWAHVGFLSSKVPVRVFHLITFDTPKYTIKPQIDPSAGKDAEVKINTVARFTNPLKEAIPAGNAQVNRLEKSGLGATLLGDVEVPRVEGGETVTLNLEKLAGVTATRVQTGFNFDGEKHFIIETFEITVANGRNETVNVTVEDSLFRWSNYEISASKPPHNPTSHPRRISWDLRLNHGEHQTIKYTSFSQSFELESDFEQP